MVKIRDKYKPRSISTISFSLGSSPKSKEVKKPVPKTIPLTPEDYYQFSRTELWSICKFEMLVFGEYTYTPNQFGLYSLPAKGSNRNQFLKLIKNAVESGELELIVQKREKEDPAHPLYELVTYNTDMVLADQAWLCAISMESKGIYKLSPEFRKMLREIMPMEFKNHIGKMPAWNVGQFVRILFGERYQDPEHWPENKQLNNLIDRIEAEIKVKKLQPLDPLPYSDIKTVSFRPVDLIKFWERYDSYLETLTWVKRLFLEIKKQEKKKGIKAKSQEGEISPTKKVGKGILPAPTGTKWGEVRIEITSEAEIKIWIKGKSQIYNLEKFKKEILTQKKMRDYLFEIIQSGGVFTQVDIAPDTEKRQFRNYISRLRKELQGAFGIQDDPLPFQEQAYRVQFKFSYKLKA